MSEAVLNETETQVTHKLTVLVILDLHLKMCAIKPY